jgi:hypothetical protein
MGTPSNPPRIDTGRAHPARVHDWLPGGEDNYPVDEAVREELPPEARDAARRNRRFMNRAAAWLAGRGIDPGALFRGQRHLRGCGPALLALR